MMNPPLVSVLTTAYNREKYIAEAIESVIASTYQNWELIIVDDQSKDRTVEIARSYEAKDSRIKVYINEVNLGDYPNRNKAASYAKVKYLKYVDADDMIYPYGLEQMVFYMEQFPEAGYGICALQETDPKYPYPHLLSPAEAYKKHYLSDGLFGRSPLAAIIRKDAFDSIGGFSGKQHVGDFELFNLLSQKYNMALIPVFIGWYRIHDDQQMNDNITDPFVPLKYVVLAKEFIWSDYCPLTVEEKQIVLQKLNKSIAKSILFSARRSFKKAVQMKKYAKCSWVTIFMKIF
jgi:glycosyltransferase involved in cell wall biosynthesis